MTKIVVRLSPKGIDDALKELKNYKQNFLKKLHIFEKRVAERISEYAQIRFDLSKVDDLLSGESRKPDVDVTVDTDGNVTTVIASGEDAVFVEFGAGVYYNGAVGSSPHPRGQALNMTIGSYGKGQGKREVWGYYDGDELRLTHGTPSAHPMYDALKDVCSEINIIARDVFE